jgi:hypothetical protein
LVKLFYIFVITLIPVFYNYAYGDNSSLIIDPSVLPPFEFANDELDKIPPYVLKILSNENVTYIKGHVSNLHSTDGKKWIAYTSLTLVPNTFIINKNNVSLVEINFNLPNKLGTYNGNITLFSDNYKKDIPILITIYDNTSFIRFIQIILVILGVTAAFFQSFILTGMESRSQSINTLEKAEAASIRANIEGRRGKNFYEGHNEVLEGRKFLNNGQYKLATRRFQRAIDYYDKSHKGDNEGTGGQQLSSQAISKIIDQARDKGLIKLGFKDTNNVVFIITAISLIIIILNVLNQVYSQLLDINTSGLWYIASFLLGYGSQSLIGGIIESIRKLS